MNELVKKGVIAEKIYLIRGVQVMLDRDLAALYETETRILKQAVKRNVARFPADFMFELGDEDISLLVSQSVIPSKKHFGGAVPLVYHIGASLKDLGKKWFAFSKIEKDAVRLIERLGRKN